MDIKSANATILTPALVLLPAKMDSKLARIMLLSIGMQESRFQYRRQVNGPARGFFQFEKGGGVHGVMTHPASRDLFKAICLQRSVPFAEDAVYNAIETDDILACCLARLLLWTDPKPLPDNADDGWSLYARVWRPGRPHPETWTDFYRQAQKIING